MIGIRHDATEALTDLRKRLAPKDAALVSQWIECLLLESTAAANAIGLHDLEVVLMALRQAVGAEDMSILSKKGTMLSVARSALPHAPTSRARTIQDLAAVFAKEHNDAALRLRLPKAIEILRQRGADRVFGVPKEGHEEKIIAECIKVREKPGKIDRKPRHYVLAFLRGWGVSAEKAKDWAKGLAG